jgi:hypothetical protein
MIRLIKFSKITTFSFCQSKQNDEKWKIKKEY